MTMRLFFSGNDVERASDARATVRTRRTWAFRPGARAAHFNRTRPLSFPDADGFCLHPFRHAAHRFRQNRIHRACLRRASTAPPSAAPPPRLPPPRLHRACLRRLPSPARRRPWARGWPFARGQLPSRRDRAAHRLHRAIRPPCRSTLRRSSPLRRPCSPRLQPSSLPPRTPPPCLRAALCHRNPSREGTKPLRASLLLKQHQTRRCILDPASMHHLLGPSRLAAPRMRMHNHLARDVVGCVWQ